MYLFFKFILPLIKKTIQCSYAELEINLKFMKNYIDIASI